MCTIEDAQGFFQWRPCSNHIVSQVVEHCAHGAVRPENSDTSHVLCVIARQSHCQDCPSSSLSHWRKSQGGNSKQKTSPIDVVTWYDGKVVLHKSIRISMEGSWPSDPKAKLPRPMLRRFLAGVCRGTYNDFHQFSSPLPV